MARAVLEEFGDLERIHFPTETEIVIFNLGRGPLVTFVNYQSGREALNVRYFSVFALITIDCVYRSSAILTSGISKLRLTSAMVRLSNLENLLCPVALSLGSAAPIVSKSTNARYLSPIFPQMLRSPMSTTFLITWATLSTSPSIVARLFVKVGPKTSIRKLPLTSLRM